MDLAILQPKTYGISPAEAAIIATAFTYIWSQAKNKSVGFFTYLLNLLYLEFSGSSTQPTFKPVVVWANTAILEHSIFPVRSFRLNGSDASYYNEDEGDNDCAVESTVGTTTGSKSKVEATPKMPNLGTYYIKHPRHGFLRINLSDEDSNPQQPGNNSEREWMIALFGQRVRVSIRMYTRDKRKLDLLIAEIEAEEMKRRITEPRAMVYSFGNWNQFPIRVGRPMSSLFLAEGQAERILNDVKNFFSKETEKKYRDAHIPYRRGMLCHGPSGTGKSSIAKALHEELKIPLYCISLKGMSDNNLFDALSSIKPRSLVLFEDLDAASVELTVNRRGLVSERYKEVESTLPEAVPVPSNGIVGSSSITLSGFLNAIDGVLSKENVYYMFTSNKPEDLDDAVVRAGRIDVHEEVTVLDIKGQAAMIKYITGLDLNLHDNDRKPCDIQALCLQYLLTNDISVFSEIVKH